MSEKLPDGQYKIESMLSRNKVLEVSGGKANDGTPVDQWQDNGKSHQRWQLTPVPEENGEVFYTIRHPNSSMVMEAPGPWKPGDPIVMRQYEDGGDQRHRQWKFIPVAGKEDVYQIVNRRSGFVIDICDGKPDGAITQRESWDAPDDRQHWRLTATQKPLVTVGKYLYAWGDNDFGQLGRKAVAQDQGSPDRVESLLGAKAKGVVAIAAGLWHSLALLDDGTLRAWGNNSHGRLGVGDINQRESPTEVKRPADLQNVKVTAIAAGMEHSLALDEKGRVWAWGNHANGRLGMGYPPPDPTWYRQEPREVPGLTTSDRRIVAIAAGGYHSLAVDTNGRVWAWGHGAWGLLGRGSQDVGDHFTPEDITESISEVKMIAVAAGLYHSMALDENGGVWTWGWGGEGQLGYSVASNWTPTPTKIDKEGVTFTAIAAHGGDGGDGGRHSLALDDKGRVWAWGKGWYGVLGDRDTWSGGNQSTPWHVGNITNTTVQAIAAGAFHSLALDHNGEVWAWGWRFRGQVGDDTTGQNLPRKPKKISDFASGTAIAAGGYHSLAVTQVEQ